MLPPSLSHVSATSSLDLVGLGHVGLDSDGFAARVGDLLGGGFRLVFAGAVVDGDGGAGACQSVADGLSDVASAAGDEGDFS